MMLFMIVIIFYSVFKLKENEYRATHEMRHKMQLENHTSVQVDGVSQQSEYLKWSSMVEEGAQRKADSVYEQVGYEVESKALPTPVAFWEGVMGYRWKRFNASQMRPPNPDGPGEMGRGVVLTEEEDAKAQLSFKAESFNVIASDKVALDREIPDSRIGG